VALAAVVVVVGLVAVAAGAAVCPYSVTGTVSDRIAIVQYSDLQIAKTQQFVLDHSAFHHWLNFLTFSQMKNEKLCSSPVFQKSKCLIQLFLQ